MSCCDANGVSCGLGSLVVWGLLWSGVWWYEGRLRAAATLRDEKDTGQLKGNLSRSVLS